MATIFPFVFLRRGFREYLAYGNAVHEQGGGRRTLQKLHAAGELVVRGTLLFPNGGGSYRDFEAFWNARFGGFEPFLYRTQNPGAAVMGDAPAVESSTQKDFAATRRYVDTATLVVRKNGTVQTLGTHYTVVNESGATYVLGTSTKLVVRFGTAPGTDATVTLAYEFLFAVRFEGDDLPSEQDLEAGGGGSSAVADRTLAIQMRETGPGFSYAAVPNAS
ncbi:MAG: DUF2460 domain-containing protein [Planctomycetes bacterium]|nr:DUF2460 domain-containing protein [Planctomycetota bacterium]